MNYPCPCCGYLTIDDGPSGTFGICPVCYWESYCVQNKNPDYVGGAYDISLILYIWAIKRLNGKVLLVR